MESEKLSLLLGFFGLILMNGFFHCNAGGKIPYYDFVVQETNFTRLCSTKTMLTVNGSFPGPTITVHRGDTVYVNVHNRGTYGLTIHWHGVKQPRNPWSDGPENITQCNIQPGKNFTYEIIFSVEEGTLWWHAHSDWTRATVHGAIVVLPARGHSYPFPTPYAQQTIVIASWFKEDVKQILDDFLLTGVAPNVSDAFTINGQPGDLYACSNETTYRMVVKHGKTYLLRIVNAVMNENQFFGIANHSLTVVGQDGAYIKPINTSYIMITPGQTMDVLVKTDQAPGYYYIVSTPFSDGTGVAFDNTTTTAILKYRGDNIVRPLSIPFPSLPNSSDDDAALNFTSRKRSLASRENVPKIIDQQLFVTIAVNFLPCTAETCNSTFKLAASMNNVSLVTKNTSILEAYYRHISGVFDEDFPSQPPNLFNFTGNNSDISTYTTTGTKVKMLDFGDAVEIVLQGTSILAGENHPIHLHGYSFYVVGSGSGNFNNKTDPLSYNLVDPPLMNTVGVPRNGWTTIRFVADNPGVWFVHCHLERHATWGMETVLIVRNGKTSAARLRAPPAHMPTCS